MLSTLSNINSIKATKSVFNIDSISTHNKIYSGELSIPVNTHQDLYYNLESLYGSGKAFRVGGPGTGYFSRLQRLASTLPIIESNAHFDGKTFSITWKAHDDITPELIYSLKDSLTEDEELFMKNRTKLRMAKAEIPAVDVFTVPIIDHYTSKVSVMEN